MKAIPGASPELIEKTGYLADRMSVNLELPTAEGLKVLAPQKKRERMLAPIQQVQTMRRSNKEELILYRHAPKFVPAGQSTQMIIGATGESDYQIMKVAEHMYQKYDMKRVFFSAFVRVNDDQLLPAIPGGPPASPGAPALSGGLAAAFLWIRDGRAVVRGEAGLQSAAGSQV